MSHSPDHGEPRDILVKSVIVAALVGAILVLHNYAVAPSDQFDPRGMLALGFVILAAFAIGELAEVIRLPHITGYLLAGLVLGPSAAHLLAGSLGHGVLPAPLDEGILSQGVVDQLGLLDSLALALIALTAGGELKLEELRRGFRQILSVLAGQAITIAVGVVGFLWLTLRITPDALPALAPLSNGAVLALGAVLASISFATSPAATIAVINSTGSKGPMTSTVLSAVVLKDVLVVIAFSAATAVSVGVLGAEGATTFVESLGHIALSIVLGAVVGAAIHLYLRFIAAELLLFLIGLIFTTTFVVQELHGEAALTFIVAGIVIGNFSDLGETLIHEVERLSMPVYVVFFTLAGAKLHLDELWVMLVPALALVTVRGLALFIGVRGGAVLSGAAPSVVRYGWMGFVSQAGLAILLASQARATYGDGVGDALFSLILGGVAINEIAGPVLLQLGLGRAGETRESVAAEVFESATDLRSPTLVPLDRFLPSNNLWGDPVPSGSAELDTALSGLERDLKGLTQRLTVPPLAEARRDAEAWVHTLRQQWLRVARRAAAGGATHADIGELGDRWCELANTRAARVARAGWAPIRLTSAIDGSVARLPETLEAPLHPSSLEERDEPVPRRARRAALRARARVRPVRREVGLRAVARYHLSGELPEQLVGLAVALVDLELYLAQQTSALFATASLGLRAAAEAGGAGDEATASQLLAALRDELDHRFATLREGLQAIQSASVRQAEAAVAQGMRRVRADTLNIGTLDLSHRERRYSRVFAQRNRGLASLTGGLQDARSVASAVLAALGLELELATLEERIRQVARAEGERLSRSLRDRGPRQLREVQTAVAMWLEQTTGLLADGRDPRAVADALRASAEPVTKRITDARAVVGSLAAQLGDHAWITGLQQALQAPLRGLTERYEVPVQWPDRALGSLPGPVPTVELALRERVLAHLEGLVTRGLLDVTSELQAHVRALIDALDDIAGVLAFNVELATSELEAVQDTSAVPENVGPLVEAMVIGAVGRSHARLEALSEASSALAETTDARVHDAVVDRFVALQEEMRAGPTDSARSKWSRRSISGSGLVELVRDWRRWVQVGTERAGRVGRRALGEDRMLSLRAWFGLPEIGDERDLRTALRPPAPAAEVPTVYHRLFSDQALEAADLLTGRRADLERLEAALTGGRLRSAAVIGLDRQAALALCHAAIRTTGRPLLELSGQDPAVLAGVHDRAIVIDDLPAWFTCTPGGFAPLQRLVQTILDDGGRNAFVVVADHAVWRFAARASGLSDAMGTVVQLGALPVDALEDAILARHAMSGYGVRFEADDDWSWQLQHILSRGDDRERRRRRAWFRTLHDASAGVLQDALGLWLASIQGVGDDETISIGAVRRPPLTRLAELPEDVLLTLFQVAWQGWVTPAQHRALFRTPPGGSEARLAQLRHVGLLVKDADKLRIAAHLRGPLERIWRRRRWC